MVTSLGEGIRQGETTRWVDIQERDDTPPILLRPAEIPQEVRLFPGGT